MKHIYLFFIGLLTATTASLAAGPIESKSAAVELLYSNATALSMRFSAATLKQGALETDSGTFAQFELPEEGGTYIYGKPMLPAMVRYVIVPPQSGLALDVESSTPRREPAGVQPLICQDPELLELNTTTFEPVEDVYPPEIATMSEPFIIRGVRMVLLTTYPIQYDAVNNEYIIRDYINATIRYTNDRPVNPSENPHREQRSRVFRRVLRELAVNPGDFSRDYGESESPYVGHYAIASHPDLIKWAAPFIEWRRRSGYKVDIVPISTGDASNPSLIKQRIQTLYTAYVNSGIDPFDYVLLIGDRSGYTQGSGSPGAQLAANYGNSIWGQSGPQHYDWEFALLDGNDQNADVGISRWCAGDERTMALFSQRTLRYVMTPRMENVSWFTRGAVFSQHWGNGAESAWHVTVHTNVRWGVEILQSLGFDDVRFHEDYTHDQQGQRVGPFEADAFNDGCTLFLGRAEDYYWRTSFTGVNANTVFPIRLVTSGHGEWTTWNMLRNGGVEGQLVLKGPVASTCGWGGPQTYAMSAVWVELVNAVVQRKIPLGWGRVLAVLECEEDMPGYGNQYSHVKTDFDCYGDPGLLPWLGVPKRVECSPPANFTTTSRLVELTVYEQGNEEAPVAGAQVSLYHNGNMPQPTDAGYATFTGMSMWTGTTDASGYIRFTFEEGTEFRANDTLFVTVTGDGICPFLTQSRITTPARSMEVAEFTLEEIDGGNGIANPGERMRLTIGARNNGSNALEGVTADVSSLSRYVTVEGDEVSFGDLGTGELSEGDGEVILTIAPNCPDGASQPNKRPEILVTFAFGNTEKRTAFLIDPEAPDIEFVRVNGNNNPHIIGLDDRDIDIRVKNVGRLRSEPLDARLVTGALGINVSQNSSGYPALAPGAESNLSGADFTVNGSDIVVPGMINPMSILLSYGENLVDSANFTLQVRTPGQNNPQGPDKYGYVCFDDTDGAWELAPEYDWYEISTRVGDRDADGTRINFDGREEYTLGQIKCIDLDFVTQFYGIEYEQISIATNGFIAFGDQGPDDIFANEQLDADNEEGYNGVTNYQNWPMDHAVAGGVGMLAPYWDDLRLNEQSGIYYYKDDEQHRMVIEWHNMSHAAAGDNNLTFQVIILDKRYWITVTGDPYIVFQYKTIREVPNIRGGDAQWTNATPYASVGISSPNGDSGLNYSYNNARPPTSAALGNRRALLFATSTQYFKAGFIQGYVKDFATGAPISRARVETSYGFSGESDNQGYFYINDALAEFEFYLTASKAFYNDSTKYELMLAEAETLDVEFFLLHPEIAPSTQRLEAAIDSGESRELEYSIQNTGNGPLNWTVARRLPRGADVDPWEFRLGHELPDSVFNDRVDGIIFDEGEYFFPTRRDSVNGLHKIQVFNRDLEFVRSFPQPEQGENNSYGFRDMGFDGELIWGTGPSEMWGIDKNGEVHFNWNCEYRTVQTAAWDEARQLLWVTGITSNHILGYTREGQLQEQLPQQGLNVYGMTIWPDDPDGFQLYIQHPLTWNENRTVIVTKMDLDTGDTMSVADLTLNDGGQPRGVFATNQYDVYSWVFMSLTASTTDKLNIWQIDARRDWFELDLMANNRWMAAEQGIINAGESQPFKLTLNTTDMPKLTFEAFLWYTHNAVGAETIIDVTMEVIDDEPPRAFSLLSPADGDTLDSLEVGEFTWQPAVDRNSNSVVSYLFRLMAGEITKTIPAENPILYLNLNDMEVNDSLFFDQEVTWWVEAVSEGDTTVSTEQFHLVARPNGVDGDGTMPVEFGLHSIFPSPFNSTTTIKVGVDRNGPVNLTAYDLQGRKVSVLMSGEQKAGYHSLVWNAANLPSGLYMLRLESAGRAKLAKVALVK